MDGSDRLPFRWLLGAYFLAFYILLFSWCLGRRRELRSGTIYGDSINVIFVSVRELRGGHFLSFPLDPALHLHIVPC